MFNVLIVFWQENLPLAWVNIPIFDYKGDLRSGEHKLYMWPITDEDILSDEQLNSIGDYNNNNNNNFDRRTIHVNLCLISCR